MIIRLLRQAFLLTYIFLTFCGLMYTLFRVQLPHVPWPFVTHFYAMMAPFQNYVTDVSMVMIYGKHPDGSWEKIPYDRYFPFGLGEYSVRIRLSPIVEKREAYRKIAQHIFEHEKRSGADFTSIRLQWEMWPKSQYGLYENYTAEHVTKTFITEYPTPE
ncbi:MAG: hypothetical protein KC680_01715 [Candidatus Peregrinibacteria bacterium]|nr:hypothetical protein [Candidatus Peregrinibacteria bacterium]MCB9807654.1 hypothetical protein [Candidatus Peribacteria bacterium]